MNRLITFTLLIFCAIYKGQNIKSDSIVQLSEFQNARNEFELYEKQHGKFIQTRNVKMHYLDWGDNKNPTLVWIHGSYSNGYELYEIADQLVHLNLHIIAIDYYGHGLTPIPAIAILKSSLGKSNN